MKIEAKSSELLRTLLEKKDFLFEAASLHQGPVHLLLPEQLSRNVEEVKSLLEEFDCINHIFFAHKSTKSLALLKEARFAGINLDVASLGELTNGLRAGFTGTQIECTGPKSSEYLEAALLHGCAISVDSLSELQKIVRFTKRLPIKQASILLRIGDLSPTHKVLKKRDSLFGLPRTALPEAYAMLKENPHITFKGVHFHNDVRDAETQAGTLLCAIDILVEAIQQGFEPTIINIGGGLRTAQFANKQQVRAFIQHLEEGVSKQEPLETWRNYSYGIYLNQRGTISGRKGLSGKIEVPEYTSFLRALLTTQGRDGRPLLEFMAENMIDLALEPGFLLSQQCGLTLLRVESVNQGAEGRLIVKVAGNMYNLSSQMVEQLTDPILISKTKEKSPCSALIAGNLCREEDMLSKRFIPFEQRPKQGDLICFLNTAAYAGGFEDGTPILQPEGKRFVVTFKDGKPTLLSEELYSPWEERDDL